jgi:hypothetical protein
MTQIFSCSPPAQIIPPVGFNGKHGQTNINTKSYVGSSIPTAESTMPQIFLMFNGNFHGKALPDHS